MIDGQWTSLRTKAQASLASVVDHGLIDGSTTEFCSNFGSTKTFDYMFLRSFGSIWSTSSLWCVSEWTTLYLYFCRSSSWMN